MRRTEKFNLIIAKTDCDVNFYNRYKAGQGWFSDHVLKPVSFRLRLQSAQFQRLSEENIDSTGLNLDETCL